MFRNLYNEKYQETYANISYFCSKWYIKDKIIRRFCSGRKRKPTGLVYLKGSPYCDDEGSSQLRSFLNDAIINADPGIGEELTSMNCIGSRSQEG